MALWYYGIKEYDPTRKNCEKLNAEISKNQKFIYNSREIIELKNLKIHQLRTRTQIAKKCLQSKEEEGKILENSLHKMEKNRVRPSAVAVQYRALPHRV